MYSTKCAQIPTDIECILVTNNSMLHASMTTKVQDSILIDALHFKIYKQIEMKIIIVVTFFLIIDFLPTNFCYGFGLKH